ncbi:MAG: patatin-like phospholipase family protein [Longimicrobiaceae bacterium]
MPRPVLVFLLALAAAPLAAQAESPGSAPRSDTVPVVLTISGGISLGSYESGVNWALVDFFRHSYHDPAFRGRYGVRPHRLEVAAGASAGNINALLSSLEWCAGYARRPPERSLLWQLWTGTGIAELFPNDRAQRRVPARAAGRGSYGIFRRESLEAFYERVVLPRLRSPGSSDCSVSLGITLTKLQIYSIELNPRIYPRAQRFASVFKLVSRTDSAGERRLEIVAADSAVRNDPRLGRMVLPLTARDGTVRNPKAILRIVEASSAFPLAFEPVTVGFYRQDRLGPDGGCPPREDGRCAPPDTATFIDGGVFDNRPLGLALRLYDLTRRGSPDSARYIYIDPDRRRAPRPSPARTARAGTSAATDSADPPNGPPRLRGLSAVGALVTGGIPAARQYELHSLARELPPSTRGQIVTTDRRHELVATHLGYFAAFLGRPFREFDFYAGIYDGLYYLAHDVVCADSAGAAKEACGRRALAGLLADSAFAFGADGRALLGHMYVEEHGPAPELPSTPPPGSPRAELLFAVDRALDPDTARAPCASTNPFGRALCRDGFGHFVRRFGTPRVRRLTRGRRELPPCSTDPEWCRPDEELNSLIRNPDTYVARLASRMVDRADNTERGLGNVAAHRAVVMAGAFYHMAAGEPRHGRELDPSSIPDTRGTSWRFLTHLLPYYVGVSTNTGGYEVGSRPTYYLGRGTAIIVPILPVHFSPTRDTTRHQAFLGYGLGGHLRLAGPVDIEGSYQMLRPYADLEAHPVSTAEVAGILADKLRLGFRFVLSDPGGEYPRANGARAVSVTLGLTDVNGLVYWTGRLVKH